MKDIVKKHWTLITAIIILWFTISVLLLISMRKNQGNLIYGLDDPYIHMAMAKNFAQHGVWGITRYSFSSSSSSILWTLLLSFIYLLFGANEVAPFILNVLLATGIIVSVYLITCRHYKTGQLYLFAFLLGIIFLTPLPALIFIGMEHILHILITIPLVFLAAQILSQENFESGTPDDVWLFILAPLLSFTRYEGLFLLFAVCSLFWLRRRWLYSLLLGAWAITPIGIYGLISVLQGWFFLPNTILIKGNTLDPASLNGIIPLFEYFGTWYKNLLLNPHLLVLTVFALIILIIRFAKGREFWERDQIIITIFLAATFLHMQFSFGGWFFRYEAYLVALGLFIVFVFAYEYLPRRISFERRSRPRYIAVLILALLMVIPFIRRGMYALLKIPQATANIYEQQYQMGLFLKEFYQGRAVAANDIGAINYLADIRCLDLVGLASLEVMKKKKMKSSYQVKEILDIVKSNNTEIAMIYDHWFQNDVQDTIPSQWIKVGEWKITHNVVCGGETVSFYALDQSEKNNLISNLSQFSPSLPQKVRVTMIN